MHQPELAPDTEQKIILAATDVFLQKGKSGARMQQIAERAGINQALLHYYFRSKERLYRKVFQDQLTHLFDHVFAAPVPQDDFRKFLRDFISKYTEYIAGHEGLVRFVIWEIQSGGHNMPEHLNRYLAAHGKSTPPFVENVRSAMKSGQIRAVHPVHFMLSLIGMCLYPYLARPLVERIFGIMNLDSTEFIEQRQSEIFRLVWAGVRPPDGANQEHIPKDH